MVRVEDGVPVVRQEHPSREPKAVLEAHPRERTRQALKIAVPQPTPGFEQVDRHEEVSIAKEGAAQPRHGANLIEVEVQSNTSIRGSQKPQTYKAGLRYLLLLFPSTKHADHHKRSMVRYLQTSDLRELRSH